MNNRTYLLIALLYLYPIAEQAAQLPGNTPVAQLTEDNESLQIRPAIQLPSGQETSSPLSAGPSSLSHKSAKTLYFPIVNFSNSE